MLNPDPFVSIGDIRQNLQLIIDFTKNKTYESFVEDIMLQYAVIRCRWAVRADPRYARRLLVDAQAR